MKTFVKSRNAKSKDDYEVWIEGGVSRTLNIFENTGDARVTVIVVYESDSAGASSERFKVADKDGRNLSDAEKSDGNRGG